MADKKVKITLKKSLIGSTVKQKRIAKALGFTKTNQVVEHNATPTVLGMANKLSHLVEVEN